MWGFFPSSKAYKENWGKVAKGNREERESTLNAVLHFNSAHIEEFSFFKKWYET